MENVTTDIVEFIQQGGHLMFPLLLLSFVIYYSCFEVYFYFYRNHLNNNTGDSWKHWVDEWKRAPSGLSEIIRYTQVNIRSLKDVQKRFNEIRMVHLAFIDRRMKFLIVIVGLAPLIGLLGTVVGMLTTFKGMAINSAGGETIDLVAKGISEALVTTQAGLFIAIPGIFFIHIIRRKRNDLEVLLTRLESLTMRKFAAAFEC